MIEPTVLTDCQQTRILLFDPRNMLRSCRWHPEQFRGLFRNISTEAGSTSPAFPTPIPIADLPRQPTRRGPPPPSNTTHRQPSNDSLDHRHPREQQRRSSPSRFRDTRRNRTSQTQEDEYHIVQCVIPGLSASLHDVLRSLSEAGYSGAPPVDHTLRRQRRDTTSLLSVQFARPQDAGQARTCLLRTADINGARFRALPFHRPVLPPKYEPLHVSPQSGPGKVVSIEGLPRAAEADTLRRALAGYGLVDNEEFQCHLVARSTVFSIWLARLKTEEEAQRMVRNLNATYFSGRQYGEKYPIRAEVFY